MDNLWPTLVIAILAFGVNVLYGIYKRIGYTNALLEDLRDKIVPGGEEED